MLLWILNKCGQFLKLDKVGLTASEQLDNVVRKNEYH